MGMQTLLNAPKKGYVVFSSQCQVMVDMKLRPVLDEDPHQAINPNESDIGPGNGCHQKTKADDHGSHRLRAENGKQRNRSRVWPGQERLPGSGDEKCQVARHSQLEVDEGLDLCLIKSQEHSGNNYNSKSFENVASLFVICPGIISPPF
jgi:hypothetical protein